MQSLMVLGRQPALGLAELESLYGADKVRPAGDEAALLDIDPCFMAFSRLGGSIKFCKLLTRLDTTDWKAIEKFLIQASPAQAERMSPGKMNLGLSAYGLKATSERITATGLSLKKAIRKTGRPVRVVPNKAPELNSAQVLHNNLTDSRGWELVFVRDGDHTLIGQTVKVQDIESYTRRDRGRPQRDAKVGMVPPKLAQIIINLAAGQLPKDKLASICDTPADQPLPRPHLEQTLLDPFCGTGVILQEAALMGYDVYGTDLEELMVRYTQQNLDWLAQQVALPPVCCRAEQADATNYKWKPPIDLVASETYLGRPFTSQPSAEILSKTVAECNLIIKKFLKNIHSQLKAGTRLCLAVPAWHTPDGQFRHLPLVDQIGDLGYNSISFEHARPEDLLYYRPDQIVARELLVITRK